MTGNEGFFSVIQAVNPQTVCCDEALFVNALRTVGFDLHPKRPFRIEHRNVDGQDVVVWRWLVRPKSRDGIYTIKQLWKWWSSPEWLQQNPTHEWAVIRAALQNMQVMATEVRAAIPRIVVSRGNSVAFIPANASPARREWLLGKLNGTIPFAAAFNPEPV